MKRIAIISVLALLGACGGGSSSGASGPQNNDDGAAPTEQSKPEPGVANAAVRDCTWLVTNDDVAVNVLYPDIFAKYWIAVLPIPSEGELSLEGQYPHARYMSFNLYNPRLEPIDALADSEIIPAFGSINPSLEGGDRLSETRDYSVRVVSGVPPESAEREPNTLYAYAQLGEADGVGIPVAVAIYRVYVPDTESDRAGNVPLPRIRYTSADGQVFEGPEACDALEPVLPTEINDLFTELPLPLPVQTGFASFNELHWLKFFGLQSSTENRFNATPIGEVAHNIVPEQGSNAGGFASNVHNNYIYSVLNQDYGSLAVFEAEIPRTPATVSGDEVMGSGDMRYWSVCTYEIASQRYYDCLFDEKAVLSADRRGVFLVGKEADRPSNATPECGVNWLPWGPLKTSLVMFRHMLPDPDFAEAIQHIPAPSGSCEAAVMGEYFPYGHHLDKAAFEALGCPVNPDAIANVATQFAPTDDCRETPSGTIIDLGENK